MARALILIHRSLSLVVEGTKENDTDRCNSLGVPNLIKVIIRSKREKEYELPK